MNVKFLCWFLCVLVHKANIFIIFSYQEHHFQHFPLISNQRIPFPSETAWDGSFNDQLITGAHRESTRERLLALKCTNVSIHSRIIKLRLLWWSPCNSIRFEQLPFHYLIWEHTESVVSDRFMSNVSWLHIPSLIVWHSLRRILNVIQTQFNFAL